MPGTPRETVFDTIRDKFLELGELCETGFSQLSGAEARLSALLGARRELMGSPGSPYVLAEEIARRSREVVGILADRQKKRGLVEGALRESLAERRRITSELRNVEARLNERVSRLGKLEAKIADELSDDPRYAALKGRLRDLERKLANGGDWSAAELPSPSPGTTPKPSLVSRMLGLVGFGGSASHGAPSPPPVEINRGQAAPAGKAEKLRNEIAGMERAVREREGATSLDVQGKALTAKMGELLAAEDSNRSRCELLFLEWRELQKGHGTKLTAALRELDRCLQSQATTPSTDSPARGQNGGRKHRLHAISELVEGFHIESERLLRNCDKTFTALKRVMDLEAELWRNPGRMRSGEIDFEQILGDVAWESRSATPPTDAGDADPSSQTPTGSSPAEVPRRYRQIKLWRDE